MDEIEDINPDKMTKDELRGFAKGVKVAQKALRNSKEKVVSTASMVKQSIIEHTVRYLMISLFIVGLFTGGYYYLISPTVEKAK